jgi:hypothetical protein
LEDHTDLIQRGKVEAPVEFGHKVLLADPAQRGGQKRPRAGYTRRAQPLKEATLPCRYRRPHLGSVARTWHEARFNRGRMHYEVFVGGNRARQPSAARCRPHP